MHKRPLQASTETERNPINRPGLPAKPSSVKPFRVTKKTAPGDATPVNSGVARKVRLSADIPHDSYVIIKTYAATVRKPIASIVHDLICSHCSR